MRPFRSRTIHVAVTAAFAALTFSGLVASGCGAEDDASLSPMSDASVDVGPSSDTRVQVIDVGEDAQTHAPLCGEEQFCDPDVAAICTPLAVDAGASDAAPPASDAGPDDDGGDAADAVDDAGDSGPSTLACRIVLRDNRSVSACAPAGAVTESNFCATDAECAPGLACVGESGLGRCLRYCCKEWSSPSTAPSADAGTATHYCTPQPLAARPTERVPVWVKLDNCTLLADELQCSKGTTCSVVTNDGRTTCVPAGPGRDYASCAEEPCDRGYVCLGTVDRRCRKLCREAEGSTACSGGGYCQKVPTIPTGYGICAGGDAGTK